MKEMGKVRRLTFYLKKQHFNGNGGTMIGIIDYDAGNIRSVEHALKSMDVPYVLSSDPEVLKKADKLILPGVGAYGDAMEKLNASNLTNTIKELTGNGKPLLGICLGLQLLFESSEESPGVEGLGILKGHILKLPSDGSLKIPHMGWNSLSMPKESRLLKGIKEGSYVYFVHSYYLKADEDVVIATSDYGVTIHAAVEKDNIFACQFHPEKSSDTGLQILKNFVSM